MPAAPSRPPHTPCLPPAGKADREEHPRRLAKRFNLDWDVCLEINPWCAHPPLPIHCLPAVQDRPACSTPAPPRPSLSPRACTSAALPLARRFVSRKRIGVDEDCYVPCDCVHEERRERWHVEEKRYYCEFDKPEPPRPRDCVFCPGDWNWCPKPEWEWFDRRCDPRREYRPIVRARAGRRAATLAPQPRCMAAGCPPAACVRCRPA